MFDANSCKIYTQLLLKDRQLRFVAISNVDCLIAFASKEQFSNYFNDKFLDQINCFLNGNRNLKSTTDIKSKYFE